MTETICDGILAVIFNNVLVLYGGFKVKFIMVIKDFTVINSVVFNGDIYTTLSMVICYKFLVFE